MVPEEGVEPTRSKAPADFESAASASSATPGLLANLTCRAPALKHPKAGWRAGEDISLVFSPLCPSHALLSLPQSTRTQPPALLNNNGTIDSWYSFHDHFATRIVSRPDRLSRLVSQRKPASDTAKSLGMITIDPNLGVSAMESQRSVKNMGGSDVLPRSIKASQNEADFFRLAGFWPRRGSTAQRKSGRPPLSYTLSVTYQIK